MVTLRRNKNKMKSILDEDNEPNIYEWHMRMLEEAKNKHIPTFVNGVLASYKKMDTICLVLEEDSYMYDFVPDDRGNVIQLCFDKVTEY